MSTIKTIDLVMLCLSPLIWSFISIVCWEAFKSWRAK